MIEKKKKVKKQLSPLDKYTLEQSLKNKKNSKFMVS